MPSGSWRHWAQYTTLRAGLMPGAKLIYSSTSNRCLVMTDCERARKPGHHEFRRMYGDMRGRSRVLAAPFSPPEHPALSVVEALWRPPGSTTPSSPMNASGWPKSRLIHGTPRSFFRWVKLGCSWPSLHSYIGKKAPQTDTKNQAEKAKTPAAQETGVSQRRHGRRGRRECA